MLRMVAECARWAVYAGVFRSVFIGAQQPAALNDAWGILASSISSELCTWIVLQPVSKMTDKTFAGSDWIARLSNEVDDVRSRTFSSWSMHCLHILIRRDNSPSKHKKLGPKRDRISLITCI